jgi:hypothetical protein
MNRSSKLILTVLLLTFVLGSAVPPTWAGSEVSGANLQKLEEQVAGMQKMIADLQGVIASQNREIQAIKTSLPATSERVAPLPAAPAPAMDAGEFKNAMKESYPWMNNLKQTGDLRLRYDASEESHCDTWTSDGLTCVRSRNRFRIRLRWGVEKKLSDEFLVGFRLATSDAPSGSTLLSDPTSTNVTMGNFFAYKPIFVDQAYVIYTPNFFKDWGPVEKVEIGAGKWKNPFEKYSTPLIWDRDVTPEGIYEQATLGLWKTERTTVRWDITGGQMVLTEGMAKNTDSELYAVQTGFDMATYAFGDNPVEMRTGFSFYGFTGYPVNAPVYGMTRGNTEHPGMTPSQTEKMNIFDLYQEFKIYPFNLPSTFWGNYFVNASPSHFPVGIDSKDSNGYGLGLILGEAKKPGGWEFALNYRYVGANATAGVFGDSDFGAYGGTNNKGWTIGVSYGLTKYLTLTWNNYIVESVESFNSIFPSSDRADQRIYKSVLDLSWKF